MINLNIINYSLFYSLYIHNHIVINYFRYKLKEIDIKCLKLLQNYYSIIKINICKYGLSDTIRKYFA